MAGSELAATTPDADRADSWPDVLRSLGFRATRGKLAVLRALRRLDHPTVEDIHAIIASQGIAISTVYRGVETLEQAGLIWSADLPRRGRVYHSRDLPRHVHLVCERCGVIRDGPDIDQHSVPGAVIGTDLMMISRVEITGLGLCAECTADAGVTSAD